MLNVILLHDEIENCSKQFRLLSSPKMDPEWEAGAFVTCWMRVWSMNCGRRGARKSKRRLTGRSWG